MTAKTSLSSSSLQSSAEVRAKLLSTCIRSLESGPSSSEKNGKLSPTSTCDEQTTTTWADSEMKEATKSREFLKYDKKDDQMYSLKRRKTIETAVKSERPKKKQRITFDETVKVQPIPPRYEYSNRVRQRLWSNAREIHLNAARNTVEFLSEGWNWRNVAEDEAMHLCSITGELIHPVHYANLGIQPGELVP